ncbi:MAG: ATP-binding protein [Bacteroidota bacterium]
MKKIAVASGKGGTGKTTVAVNLFHQIANDHTAKVELVDCDVEEPNDHLFFEGLEVRKEKQATQLIPTIDNDKCTYCRKCAEWCEFNAIVVIPPAKFAEVNPSLCHSCGACIVACEHGAISENPEEIGVMRTCNTGNNGILTDGSLKIGSAMQTMLIKQVKEQVSDDNEVVIFDAPPGTSCPVVETVSDSDYVILVTEPTPFGLHDLKLTVELLKEINKPFGVVVNKAGLGDRKVYDYLEEEQIEMLGEIPFQLDYASLYAKGELLKHIPEDVEPVYRAIAEKVLNSNNAHS